MAISVSSSSGTNEFVEADGINKIQFRTGRWELNARDPKKIKVYLPQALAITSVFASIETGKIYDTDIEINAVNALWGDLVTNPQLARSSNMNDLQNALTHEIGHVIGLDHSCDGGGQSNFTDNEGNPVPRCPGPIEIQETTTAAVVSPGDTQRGTLTANDQQGVCIPAISESKGFSGEERGQSLTRAWFRQ